MATDFLSKIKALLYGEEPKSTPVDPALAQLQQSQMMQTPTQPVMREPQGADVATGQMQVDNQPQIKPQASPAEMYYANLAKAQEEQDRLTKPLLEAQAAGVSDIENEINTLKNQPKQLNIAPLLAWADSFGNGSKLAENYKAPMTEQERAKIIIDLKEKLQSSRGDLTSKQIQALKDRFQGRAFESQARQGRADRSQISKWQEGIDNDANVKSYSKLLDQATTDYNTLKRSLDGKETVTPQMFSELQTGLARLIQGPGALPMGREEAIQMKSFEEDLGRFAQRWSGKPVDAIPQEFKEALLHSFERLKSQWEERRSEAALRKIPPQMDMVPGADNYINQTLGKYGVSIPGYKLDSRYAPVKKEQPTPRTMEHSQKSTSNNKRLEDMSLEELRAEKARRAGK